MPGLLLVNLGTPDEPSPPAVRRYLRQFLSDPRVLDMNPVGRALLLNLVILPLRPRLSAAAYLKIWTDRGSPLLVHGRDLVAEVKQRLGDDWQVELGMRYGQPSIAGALDRLDARPLVVLPLYPQYSSAATGSSLEEVFRVLGARQVVPGLSTREDFFAEPGFLDAFSAVAAPLLARELAADPKAHVLMSFHGLPERQVKKADPSGVHCLVKSDCCDSLGPKNRHCYRAQCFATARALATRLGLRRGAVSVSFQSRLGRTPWIRPYTDSILRDLAAREIKRLLVLCPAFVADCLETLEEIGIRGREQWKSLGGEELTLVPSLNASPAWAETVAQMASRLA